MDKIQIEKLLIKAAELLEEIKAIPGSTANGQLIDAASHIKNSTEHLKRYYALSGGKL